ncbi:MAG: hypothetical protein J5I90_04320 [Caldilineales bacterium]|nr:hypothetical protein [Caldilineales bacterium]
MTRLQVAIIWHMHQPYYRQPGSDLALLPWVRLHAAKDYLHMAQVAARFPSVHVTFTMAPSLAEQLQDYAAGRLRDRLMDLAVQNDFSSDDKRYLLNICYSIEWNNIVRRYPPYAALLDQRDAALHDPDGLPEQFYRDLIVWFHLAWTDPNLLENDPLLRALVAKGEGFSIAESTAVVDRHLQIVAEVIPTYRRLQAAGQIELITVPYFHPILPLLIDTDSARRASPSMLLPQPAFRFAEDAAGQIESAVGFHSDVMGRQPRGMWPAEGSVSPEVAELAAAQGIEWLASDEAVLGRSLDTYFERDDGDFVLNPELLYRPYRLQTAHGPVSIVFRDHHLSDRIGFTYQGWAGEHAAEDMIDRLRHIHHQLSEQERPGLVSLILDGENAWEHYAHNGDEFLNAFYERLRDDPDLRAVTVSEHLDEYPTSDDLTECATGSWILGDFTTWIGDAEHNEAWSRLRDLRVAYQTWAQTNPDPQQLDLARRYLFAAEGSDWFWWYSHRNSSDQDAVFDRTFIAYLAAAYESMGQSPPAHHLLPIHRAHPIAARQCAFLSPQIGAGADGVEAWSTAVVLEPQASIGSMQEAGRVLQALRYGNDFEWLYLRLELGAPVSSQNLEANLHTEQGAYSLRVGRGQRAASLHYRFNGASASLGEVPSTISERSIVVALSLADLGLLPLSEHSQLAIQVALDNHSAMAERLPSDGQHRILLAIAPDG